MSVITKAHIDMAWIETVLANEYLWYRRGNWLYVSALAIQGSDIDNQRITFVGTTSGRDLSDSELLVSERDSVAEMLIGMAIEAWLKGLIVNAHPRESRKKIREAESHRNDDELPYEASFHEIMVAYDSWFKDPKVAALFGEAGALQTSENASRKKSLPTGGQAHDLRQLARIAGVLETLSEDERLVLDYYSSMIPRGRYPAIHKEHDIVAIDDLDRFDECRRKVMETINNRWLEMNGPGAM